MIKSFFKETASANSCRAMETRDHVKNGVSPKDQMSRENQCYIRDMKKVFLFLVVVVCFCFSTFCQNTIIIQQSTNNSSETISKKTEENKAVNGVEYELLNKGDYLIIEITNYNNFSVTCNYIIWFQPKKVDSPYYDREETIKGQMVVGSNQSRQKSTQDYFLQHHTPYRVPANYKIIGCDCYRN